MDNKTQAEKIEKLAGEIYKFLLKHGLWQDVRIYFNGKAYCSYPVYRHPDGTLSKNYVPGAVNINYNNPDYLHVIENIDPSDYMVYYNRDTITMSFEGVFYEVLNYGAAPKLQEAFDNLIKNHGYYYEFGNAWNLALYEM